MILTVGVHVPLHEALNSAGYPDDVAELAARADFEAPGVRAHLLRTIAAILAFVSLVRALWLGPWA